MLYKVENGKRSDLPVKGAGSSYGVKTDVPDQGWGELRVTARGPLFAVYLGERKLFEVEDRTLTGAGRVCVWPVRICVVQGKRVAVRVTLGVAGIQNKTTQRHSITSRTRQTK